MAMTALLVLGAWMRFGAVAGAAPPCSQRCAVAADARKPHDQGNGRQDQTASPSPTETATPTPVPTPPPTPIPETPISTPPDPHLGPPTDTPTVSLPAPAVAAPQIGSSDGLSVAWIVLVVLILGGVGGAAIAVYVRLR
jgi:hypothetical protein